MENQLYTIEGSRVKFLGTNKPARNLGKLAYNFNTKCLDFISSDEYTGSDYKSGLFPLDFGYADYGIVFINSEESLAKEYCYDEDNRNAKELFDNLSSLVNPFELRGHFVIYLTSDGQPVECNSLLDAWCCQQMKYKRIESIGRGRYYISSKARETHKRVRFE